MNNPLSYRNTVSFGKRQYAYVMLITFLCIGCGADTDIKEDATGPARIIDIKPPEIREGADGVSWHAEFDIVFSSPPVNLQAESTGGFFDFFHWEQQGNIVTLYFKTFNDHVDAYDSKIHILLVWNVGRKKLILEAEPPD